MGQAWETQITAIHPIEGKDRIELATVNGYQSIIPKGRYAVGDPVVYISENSLVPVALQQELGLEDKAKGRELYRIKPMKMGGVLSQGIICAPNAWAYSSESFLDDDALDKFLGIEKWEPVLPLHLSGKVARPKGNAPICPMYDIENIKKQRHLRQEYDDRGNVIGDYWYDPFDNQLVTITEKLHGTNFAVHMNVSEETPYIYSKGLGRNGHILLEEAENVYWKAFRMYPEIEEAMLRWCQTEPDRLKSVTVRGEVIGTGIQDLDYGVGFDLVLFAIEGAFADGRVISAPPHEIDELLTVPQVPILYDGPYEYDIAYDLSLGTNVYGETGKHVREGVVVCGRHPHWQMNGMRNAAKFINPDYLVRKGATEFN